MPTVHTSPCERSRGGVAELVEFLEKTLYCQHGTPMRVQQVVSVGMSV